MRFYRAVRSKNILHPPSVTGVWPIFTPHLRPCYTTETPNLHRGYTLSYLLHHAYTIDTPPWHPLYLNVAHCNTQITPPLRRWNIRVTTLRHPMPPFYTFHSPLSHLQLPACTLFTPTIYPLITPCVPSRTPLAHSILTFSTPLLVST